MSVTIPSTQLPFAQDLPNDSASHSHRLLDDVDIFNIVSRLSDLTGPPLTPNKPSNPTMIRTSSTSPASTVAENPFTALAVSPTIITQRSASTPRRHGHPRRRSTHRHPLSHSQLQPRVNTHKSALLPTSKRPDRRRSRTYWPVWYQKQRRREYKEAARNKELDKRRLSELMELWEEEWFQIVMNALTEYLKREVLRLALELREQLEEWEELEDYLSE